MDLINAGHEADRASPLSDKTFVYSMQAQYLDWHGVYVCFLAFSFCFRMDNTGVVMATGLWINA